MRYFLLILPKLLNFLLLIGAGYCIAWKGIIQKESLPSFASLLLNVVLPCLNIALLAQRGTTFGDLWECRRVVGWQILTYLIMAAVGIVSARLAGLTEPRLRNVHRGCCVGGNYAFVVIPLMLALFPEEGAVYVPICSAVDTITVWTLGLALFTMGTGGSMSLKQRLQRILTPTLVSILLAICLNTWGIALPELLMTPITYVGEISYSLGFLYVGCSIFFMPKASLHYLKPVSLVAAGKLLAAPLLVYLLSGFWLTQSERLILVLIAGAPSMTTSVMICRQYGLEEDYASATVFLTTLACMATIPALFGILSIAG